MMPMIFLPKISQVSNPSVASCLHIFAVGSRTYDAGGLPDKIR